MILPNASDRGIVVFKVWPSLAYEKRMLLSFLLIALGPLIQVPTEEFLAGVVLLIAGNLLRLGNGYDNRVDFGKFDFDAHWERVEVEQLTELEKLDRKIKQWDQSALDITNTLGGVVFFFLAAGLGAVAVLGTGYLRIFALDGLVLLVPHWVTGVRSTLMLPKLLIRVRTIRAVLQSAAARLEPHRVGLMMLLEGAQTKLPEDLKIKIDIDGQHPDFLGLHGHVVLNDMQGTSHPCFYVVLVARKGCGTSEADVHVPGGITVENKRQDEVEVLVLRQTTTKTSGYATKPKGAARIFDLGLDVAERVTQQPVAG